jgi:hypothetical protein
MRGDFRHSHKKNIEFDTREILRPTQEARQRRAS